MRATLSFSLPEEREEFNLAQKAGDYSCVLYTLDQEFFRANVKYGLQPDLKTSIINGLFDKELQEKVATLDQEVVDSLIQSVLQVCRTKLHDLAQEYEVSVV